uniref:Uncharacterized protein n=1 Tax=Arundo donax TaxID=35708 RepID=A0A0A9GTN6_ARUDO
MKINKSKCWKTELTISLIRLSHATNLENEMPARPCYCYFLYTTWTRL